ncbi:hypothetical protein ORI89_10180 [Sphingobacterium sp. UT-1RO-CII-1]|uniref:hypothetical protein n=1 Tax=Sphingobacterium sp. UT-1RO-CII-1 TaxID=2995225 RepID=UPI00227BD15F|nr:hypothetical protein [Sphingobacterium sp. UT-1RO-CII-1]MCY4780018.1 hypothetical protein [Sphingobacterium sp. UT-1RO-CII-1]
MNLKKQISILICLVAVVTTSYCQELDPNSTLDHSVTKRTVTKDLKLPTRKETGKKRLSGKYWFVVELDGSLSEVAVKDSIGYGVDEQIVKRLLKAKNWKVVKVGNVPTRIAYELPIVIELDKK